jgi:hypothetical protein
MVLCGTLGTIEHGAGRKEGRIMKWFFRLRLRATNVQRCSRVGSVPAGPRFFCQPEKPNYLFGGPELSTDPKTASLIISKLRVFGSVVPMRSPKGLEATYSTEKGRLLRLRCPDPRSRGIRAKPNPARQVRIKLKPEPGCDRPYPEGFICARHSERFEAEGRDVALMSGDANESWQPTPPGRQLCFPLRLAR